MVREPEVPASGASAEEASVAIEGLLDGLTGTARQERAQLIGWLLGAGYNVAQIRESLNPISLPANRVLGDDGDLVTVREVAESSGVSVELLQQLHRAAGLAQVNDPDARVLSRADAEAVLTAASLVELGIDGEDIALFVRLITHGLARAAATLRSMAMHALVLPGATELELAQAVELSAREIRPRLGPMIDDLFRLTLRQQVDTEAVNLSERTAGKPPGAREVAVAFADLVGFTELGEALPPEEVARLAGRFAVLAHDLVGAPVQFVKSIGDAVMLVCPNPEALLGTVFELIDSAADEQLPRLRVGAAYGLAYSRFADWYGSPVNMANRVTALARPGEVLVAESMRVATGDDNEFSWSSGAARSLKGISSQVLLWRVER